jgi:hypothetical protein
MEEHGKVDIWHWTDDHAIGAASGPPPHACKCPIRGIKICDLKFIVFQYDHRLFIEADKAGARRIHAEVLTVGIVHVIRHVDAYDQVHTIRVIKNGVKADCIRKRVARVA